MVKIRRALQVTGPLLLVGILAAASSSAPAFTGARASVAMHSVSQSGIIFGAVTDPVGDAEPPTIPGLPPDLVGASILGSGNNLSFSVEFAPGAFNAATTIVTVTLDTDQNPATGFPGVTFGTPSDTALMGTDFLVTLLDGAVSVRRFVALPSVFELVGVFPATFSADAFDVTIPLSALGDDDGVLNFKVASGVSPSPVLLDLMPDAGLAPGRTTLRQSSAGIEIVAHVVDALLAGDVLTPGQASGLLDKLNAVLASLERGSDASACNQLQAFMNQVKAFVRNGSLSLEQGETLLELSEEVRVQIGC